MTLSRKRERGSKALQCRSPDEIRGDLEGCFPGFHPGYG